MREKKEGKDKGEIETNKVFLKELQMRAFNAVMLANLPPSHSTLTFTTSLCFSFYPILSP